MIDMQLLNNTLMALAVLVGAAITFSVAIVAIAAIAERRRVRHGGAGGSGGPGIDLPRRPAPEIEDVRTLVLH
jgi:hypothetical protein